MAQISEEVKTQLEQIAEDGFNYWKDNCTEEQKAAGLRMAEEMKSQPEAMQQMLAKMTAWFTEADADQNGLLNEAEYLAFMEKVRAETIAQGQFVDTRDEMPRRGFAAINSVSSEQDGIALAEFFAAG